MLLSIRHVAQRLKRMKNSSFRGAFARVPVRKNLEEDSIPEERHMVILLDLIDHCNLRCVMCPHLSHFERPASRLSMEAFERLAQAVFPITRQINLSCGYEPFILKNIADYVAVTRRYEIPFVYLTTNATLLNRPNCEQLVAAGLPCLAVSIDGATRETYESIRVRAHFDRLIENLRTLIQVKTEMHSSSPTIQFNYVLMEETIAEATMLVERMSEFGPRKYVFIHRDYTAPPDDNRFLYASVLRKVLAECVRRKVLFEEIPNYCLTPAEILEAYGCRMWEESEIDLPCVDPWNLMRLMPNGDVYACPVIEESVGNILHEDPIEIWRGEKYNKLRVQLKTGKPHVCCQTCPYNRLGQVQTRLILDRMERIILRQIDASERLAS